MNGANKETKMTTAPHEMNKRIRFGSDGNGVFVAVCAPINRAPMWRVFEDERTYLRFVTTHVRLPVSERRAGLYFLRCEWNPSERMPPDCDECTDDVPCLRHVVAEADRLLRSPKMRAAGERVELAACPGEIDMARPEVA